jgi:hypothetical protein
MSIEAMKQALEALEYHTAQTRPITQTQDAITALRTAIEQAEKQEPEDVTELAFEAWWLRSGQFLRAGGGDYEKTFAYHAWLESLACTTPPAAPVQEPVTLNRAGVQKLLEQSGYDNANPEEMAAFISGIRHREAEMLDTPPAAQRQWVGLTDEEAIQVAIEIDIEFKDEGREQQEDDIQTFAHAIEAKLREKNSA